MLNTKPKRAPILSMESWAATKKLYASKMAPTTPSQWPQLGVVQRSPDIYLAPEQNPENLRRPSDDIKGYVTSHRLKWGTLPPNDIGIIAQHMRVGGGKRVR